MNIATAKNFALDLLFPKICFSCSKDGAEFCSDCLAKIQFKAPQCLVCNARSLDGKICNYCRTKTSLARFFAVGDYDDPILREAIHFLKYRKVTSLAPILAELVYQYWLMFMKNLPKQPDILVPVPLHPKRERERGFNQAEIVAKFFSEKTALPFENRAISRQIFTPPQVGIEDPEKRRKNVEGVFSVFNPSILEGKTILLFDDVATTGATLNEAAQVLRDAGAYSVWALVLAR